MSWQDCKIGDQITLQRGVDITKKTARPGKIPVISSGGTSTYHDTAISDGPGVVIGRKGTLGTVFWSDGPYWPHDTTLWVKDFKGNEPRFVYYFLQTIDTLSMDVGAANPTLNRNHVHPLLVRWPDIKAQVGISKLLGCLDDKIEVNRRMNETLEAMARAVFRDWFVDFGPTRRQMAGASDPHAILGGLIQNSRGMAGKVGTGFPSDMPTNNEEAHRLAALFPSALGDNGLPEGWETQPFQTLLSDTIGGDWGKELPDAKHDRAIGIIRGTDFPDIQVGTTGKAPTRFTTGKKLERRELAADDILLEVSGGSPTQPTGRSIMITQTVLDRFDTPVVCASFCRRFRCIDRAAAQFAYQHLQNLYAEGGTWEYQNQSTGISNFQTTHFVGAELVVQAGAQIRNAYAKFVEPTILLAYSNENRTLAATRDLLLPKLMSGEIRLSDAEAMV